LIGAQCLYLSESKVVGKPALHAYAVDALGRATRGEFRMLGNVRGFGDVQLVARDQYPISGGDEIGFNEIRPLLYRKLIGGQRVFGQIAAGSAVGDHDRRLPGKRRKPRVASTASHNQDAT